MRKDLIVHEAPKSTVSEAIRNLRTNLTYKMTKTGKKVLLVTSSSSGEGKSWLASNLAVAFAQSKQKVLIIDADLRKGRQHEIYTLKNVNGLSDVLTNKRINKENEYADYEIQKLVQPTEVDNVSVLTYGIVPHNPSEILENEQFEVMIDVLKPLYDVIIIDSPPINIVTDSMIICSKVDGVILTCGIGVAKKEALREAKKRITTLGGTLLGVVINRMPQEKMKEYAKDYNKYYSNQIIKYDNNIKTSFNDDMQNSSK